MGRATRNFFATLCAVAVLATAPARAPADEEGDARTAALRYPGPPLWRVSNGDHELWLFGTLSAVPKNARWSADAVEDVIARSDVVLSPPGVRATPSMKPVQLIRLWRRVRELSENPGGATLAQTLPREVYSRYSLLRDRYLRRERNIERDRPIIAAGRLYEAAVDAMGLEPSRDVDNGIERAARRAGVPVLDTKLHADPEVLLEHAARTPKAAELDCFVKVLATIEADEHRLAARARAWAVGDVAALEKFAYPDIRRECLAFPGWSEALGETLDDADELWLESADLALERNGTTFATLDLRELIRPDGLLARLRARGYEVDAP